MNRNPESSRHGNYRRESSVNKGYFRESNRNKITKRKSSRMKAGVALSAIAVGIGLGIHADKVVHSDDTAPETSHTVAEQVQDGESGMVITADIEKGLRLLQAMADRDFTGAPTDIPGESMNSWTMTSSYPFHIEKGGGIVVDALEAYAESHGLSGPEVIPTTIKDSIAVTANSFVERERAQGKDDAVQPEYEFALTEVTKDGMELAVVSGPVKFDTN